MASPFNSNDLPTVADLIAAGAGYLIGAGEDYGITDDEEQEEEDDEDYVPVAPPFRVSQNSPRSPASNEVIVIPNDESQNTVEEETNKRRRIEGEEASCSSLEASQGNGCNLTDIDGLNCPICMDVWTNSGDHHICCLPCGHIYGMSCIKKWLQQRRKCPQCNKKCSLKDVRKLYASRLVAVDEESQKRIRSLEAKCAAFVNKDGEWHKKEAQWKKREAALHSDVQTLTERTNYLEKLVQDMRNRQFGLIDGYGNTQMRYESGRSFDSRSYGNGSFCKFELQNAFHLDGARIFDMDTTSQILLIAQKPKMMGSAHLLTKMSMISPFEMQDILLPSSTDGIRDLHISPSNNKLALFASLGKKLSVLSIDNGNPVVSYDLKDSAWSCSWDRNSSHHVYAGLQNGSILVFDMRQTAGPLKSLVGLTSNPVHSVQSLPQVSSPPSGGKTILSASGVGLCQWNIDSEERPFVVPETDNQGVCISLACCPSSDDIVASYRPKIDMFMDVPLSQPSPTPNVIGQGVQGSHVLLKKTGSRHFQK